MIPMYLFNDGQKILEHSFRFRLDFAYDGGNKITTIVDPSRSHHQHECILSPGEVIHKVNTWYYNYASFPVRGGIQFFTTEKTCGPYGITGNDMDTVEGYTLLTAYGRVGWSFDQIVFVFDRCV